MKLTVRQVIVFILLISPLTFWGQGKNSYGNKNNSKPVFTSRELSRDVLSSSNYLYVVGGLGTNLLHGENGIFSIPGLGCQVGIGYQAFDFIGIEGKLGCAMLSAGNFEGIETQYTSILEANINLMINLTNLIGGNRGSRKYEWILHAGYGQTQSRCRAIYENGDMKSFGYPDHPEYNNTIANGKVDGMWTPTGGGINGRIVARTYPVGVILSYKLTERFKLNFDLTTTYVDSDRFDAVPAGYHYDLYTQFDVRVQYRLKLRQQSDSPCDNMFGEYRNRRNR